MVYVEGENAGYIRLTSTLRSDHLTLRSDHLPHTVKVYYDDSPRLASDDGIPTRQVTRLPERTTKSTIKARVL